MLYKIISLLFCFSFSLAATTYGQIEDNSILDVIPAPIIKDIPFSTKLDNVEVEVNGEVGAKVFVNGVYAIRKISLNGKVNVPLDTSGIDGNKDFSITLIDYSGNESEAFSFTILKDTVPPNKPMLTQTFTHTNKDNIEVEVKGEIGTKVFVNGKDTNKVIASNGKVKVTLDTSGQDGERSIRIQLKDKSLNWSYPLYLIVNKDTLIPSMPYTQKLPVSTNLESLNIDLVGEPEARIVINEIETNTFFDANKKANIILDTSGIDGDKEFNIFQVDKAGNQSELLKIIIIKDTLSPIKPILTEIAPKYTGARSEVVEVNGEIGAKVFVNGIDTNKVIASNGKVKVILDTSGQDGNKVFNITLKDSLTNESEALTFTIEKGSFIVNNRIEAINLLNSLNGDRAIINGKIYTHIVKNNLDFWTDNPSGDGQELATEIFTKGDRTNLPTITHDLIVLTKKLGNHSRYTKNGIRYAQDENFYQWFYNSNSMITNMINYNDWETIEYDRDNSLGARDFIETKTIKNQSIYNFFVRDSTPSLESINFHSKEVNNIALPTIPRQDYTKEKRKFVLDSNDTPYLAYNENNVIKILKLVNNEWKLILEEKVTHNMKYYSLSTSVSNELYLIYRDTNYLTIKIYNLNTNKWESTFYGKNDLFFSSMKIDSKGNLYIKCDHNSCSKNIYKYDKYNNKLDLFATKDDYASEYNPTDVIILIDEFDNLYTSYFSSSSEGTKTIIKKYNLESKSWELINEVIGRFMNRDIDSFGTINMFNRTKNYNLKKYNIQLEESSNLEQSGYVDLNNRGPIIFSYKNIFRLKSLNKNLIDIRSDTELVNIYNKNNNYLIYKNKLFNKTILNNEICFQDKEGKYLTKSGLIINSLPKEVNCLNAINSNNILELDDMVTATNWENVKNNQKIKIKDKLYTHFFNRAKKLDFWTDNPNGDGQEFATEIFTKGDRTNLPVITHELIVLTKKLGNDLKYTKSGIKYKKDENFYQWFYSKSLSYPLIDYNGKWKISSSYDNDSGIINREFLLDNNKKVYVKYMKQNKLYIKYYNNENDSWESIPSLPNDLDYSFSSSSILFNQNNELHVFYRQGYYLNGNYYHKLKVSKLKNNQWIQVGENVDNRLNKLYNNGNILSYNNELYVLYKDRASHLKIKKFNVTTKKWESIIYNSGIAFSNNEMTSQIDSNRNIYIKTYYTNKVLIHKYDFTLNKIILIADKKVFEEDSYNLASGMSLLIDSSDNLYLGGVLKDADYNLKFVLKKYDISTNNWIKIAEDYASSPKTFLALDSLDTIYKLGDNREGFITTLNKENNSFSNVLNTTMRYSGMILPRGFKKHNIPYLLLNRQLLIPSVSFTNLYDDIPFEIITQKWVSDKSIEMSIKGSPFSQIIIDGINSGKKIPESGIFNFKTNYVNRKIKIKLIRPSLIETKEKEVFIQIDKEKPILNNNSTILNNQVSRSKMQKIAFTYSDDLSGIDLLNSTFKINNNIYPITSLENKIEKEFENGEYNVFIKLTDYAGNEKVEQINFTIDTIKPSKAIFPQTPIQTNKDSTEVEVIGEVGAKVFVNGKDTNKIIPIGGKVRISLDTNGADGYKHFTIMLKDVASNESEDAKLVIQKETIKPNKPMLLDTPIQTNKDSIEIEIIGEVGAKVFVNGKDTNKIIPIEGKVKINLDTSGANGYKHFIVMLKDAANNESETLELILSKGPFDISSRSDAVSSFDHLNGDTVEINGKIYTHIVEDELDFWTDNAQGDGQEFATEIFTKGDISNVPKITHKLIVLTKKLNGYNKFSKSGVKSVIDDSFYQWHFFENPEVTSFKKRPIKWESIADKELLNNPTNTRLFKIEKELYRVEKIFYKENSFKLKKFENNKWVQIGIQEFDLDFNRSIYLEKNKKGELFFTYVTNESYNKRLVIQKFSNNKWTLHSLKGLSTRVTLDSFKLNKNDVPYIVTYNNSQDAIVMKFINDEWINEGDSLDRLVFKSSIIFDKDNIPYVAYFDYGNNKLKIKKFINNKWKIVQEFLPDDNKIFQIESLQVDFKNNLYLMYTDNERYMIMRFDGITWIDILKSLYLNKREISKISFSVGKNPFLAYTNKYRITYVKEFNNKWNDIDYISEKEENPRPTKIQILSDNEELYIYYNINISGASKNRNNIKKALMMNKNLIDSHYANDFNSLYKEGKTSALLNNRVYLREIINDEICYRDELYNYYNSSGKIILDVNNMPSNITCKLYTSPIYTLKNRTEAIEFENAKNNQQVKINGKIYTHIVKNGLDFWTDNSEGDGQEFATEIFTKGSRKELPLVTHNLIVLTKELDEYDRYSLNGNKSEIDNSFYQWNYIEKADLSTIAEKNMKFEIVGKEDFTAHSSQRPNIVIDKNNLPIVIYQNYDDSTKLYMNYYNGNYGQGTNTISRGEAHYSSISYKNGVLYVAYIDKSYSNKIIVKKFDGNSWSNIGINPLSKGEAKSISINVDNNNIPYIAYTDKSNSYKIVVKKYDGQKWERVGNNVSSSTVGSLAISIDNNNIPYIAYSKSSDAGRISVKKFNGTSWKSIGNSITPALSGNLNLKIDNENNLYLLYTDGENGGKISVIRYMNSLWERIGQEHLSMGRVYYSSLDLDKNGNPYIIYYDKVSKKVIVKKFNGTKWKEIDESQNYSNYEYPDDTDITIDKNGIPYIVFAYGKYGEKRKLVIKRLKNTYYYYKNLIDIELLNSPIIENIPLTTNKETVDVHIKGNKEGEVVYINGKISNLILNNLKKGILTLDTSGKDGYKDFSITLKDPISSMFSKPFDFSIYKDLTSPELISGWPSKGSKVKLNSNNEIAIYYTFSDVSLDSIKLFDNNGNDITNIAEVENNGISLILNPLIDTKYNYKIIATDIYGNETVIDLEFNAKINKPKTIASKKSGKYNKIVSVDLISDRETTIYYSLDGYPPIIGNLNTYSGKSPIENISISKTTNLQFFAVDNNGNEEAINSEIYKFGELEEPNINLTPIYNSVVKQVELKWNSLSDVQEYKIYRVLSSLEWEPFIDNRNKKLPTSTIYLLDSSVTNSFIDKNIDEGSSYYYAISKVNKKGVESLISEPTLITVLPNSKPTSISDSIKRSKNWLYEIQNKDGSWGDNENLKLLFTTSVLDALSPFKDENKFSIYKGLSFIQNKFTNNNDYLSRKIITLNNYGLYIDDNISKLIYSGYGSKSTILGWGLLKYLEPSPYDTILASKALNRAKRSLERYNDSIENLKLSWMKDKNNQYWGWTSKGDTNIFVSSSVYNLLESEKSEYKWITESQKDDGSFGSGLLDTIGVLLNLQLDNVKREKALNYIISQQNIMGNYNNDPYLTALCLKVLYYEGIK
ncbi:hypothetical protein CRV02_12830 [Arcobacter sp. CECT 8989]|uniref:chitobiase/beta-hexosaminidase C-terminal domain-containing protein n=1 Tax=Arcobacter sp. CECT 8989 TaxID=2044509 RepID=UPI00100A531F|nr:chitobiase/beta-hexosaminidase C-terminal domain-containing protein [Arcobacter sp. CECT 8989]RXJ98930.1 hypothetical protein CRV02_12830 [Arcobacter sp. CECT 8989]